MEKLPKDPVLLSYYVGDFDKWDEVWLSKINQLLDIKIAQSDTTIDIQKLADYCQRTELVARQMVNYLENYVYYGKMFNIINGSKEYEQADQVRAAKIQERSASQSW